MYQQFQFGAVAKKESVYVLSPCRPAVQMNAVPRTGPPGASRRVGGSKSKCSSEDYGRPRYFRTNLDRDILARELWGIRADGGTSALIETCKLTGVDPQAYFADVLTKLVNLWPASRLDELMPWA
jgi:hypothetical protein